MRFLLLRTAVYDCVLIRDTSVRGKDLGFNCWSHAIRWKLEELVDVFLSSSATTTFLIFYTGRNHK